MELHEVHALAAAVLRDREQLVDVRKAREPRELWRDVAHRDRQESVDLDLAGPELVAAADLHVRPHPDAYPARSLPALDPIVDLLRNLHAEPYRTRRSYLPAYRPRRPVSPRKI